MSTTNGSSETFHNDEEGEENDSPTPHSNGAPRTMADITRLFMNGAGPANPHRPQRLSPQARAARSSPPSVPGKPYSADISTPPIENLGPNIVAPISAAPPESTCLPDDLIENQKSKIEDFPAPLPLIQILLTDPAPSSTSAATESLLKVAQQLAQSHACTVGIIAATDHAIGLWRVSTGTAPPFAPLAADTSASSVDVQLARALFALRPTIDAWLIVPSLQPHALDSSLTTRILASSPHWLLASGTDNAALIGAYRTLKTACASTNTDDQRRVRLFVLTTDSTEAAQAHTRLNHVAQGFLDYQLELLPTTTSSTSPQQPAQLIAKFPVTSASQAAWHSVLDFIREQTAPIETDSETCEIPILTTPAVPPRESVLSNPRIASHEPVPTIPLPLPNNTSKLTSTPFAPNSHTTTKPIPIPILVSTPRPRTSELLSSAPLNFPSLRAVEAPAASPTRPQLWSLIRDSIAGLLTNATILDALPPQQDAALLAADPTGRLHLWILANPADLTAWSVAWQWTQLHRQLIAMTQRHNPTLHLDPAAAVHAHIILPPGERPPTFVTTADITFRWYRTEPLTWGPRTGLIVIPCHAE